MKKCLKQANITTNNNGKTMLVLATMLTLAVGVILSTTIPQSEAKESYRSCTIKGMYYLDVADLCIPWPKGCPDPNNKNCPGYGIKPIEEPPAADVVQEPTDEEPPEDQEQGSEQSSEDEKEPPEPPREEPAESAE